MALVALLIAACGTAEQPAQPAQPAQQAEPQVIEREVVKEVEVTREVQVQVEKEKIVEVEKEVVKEVPIEKVVFATPVAGGSPDGAARLGEHWRRPSLQRGLRLCAPGQPRVPGRALWGQFYYHPLALRPSVQPNS